MRHIGIVMPVWDLYFHGILGGIAEYVAGSGPWITYIPEFGDITAADIRSGVPLDGVIMSAGFRGEFKAEVAAAAKRRLPAVGVLLGTPAVQATADNDDHRVGATVAEAFLERGFEHFAFYGWSAAFSQRRQLGFIDRLKRAGKPCIAYDGPEQNRLWGHGREVWENADFKSWLTRLPKPVGIFVVTDVLARQVLYCCTLAGIRAPDDVAVIGVDNDPVVCELTNPPLSSVPLDLRRVGYEAARLLDRILAGDNPPADPVLIPPLPIMHRRSSDFLAIDAPDIVAAVRYIREHATENIGVEHVVRNVAVSRRKLEQGFRKHFNRTPQTEIWRARVSRAKVMLEHGRQSMSDIASGCGFSTASRLQVVFKRLTGVTPTAYRKSQQAIGLKDPRLGSSHVARGKHGAR